MTPAGFWRRYAAYSLDIVVVLLLASPLLAWRVPALFAPVGVAMEALQMRMWALMDESFATGNPDPMAMATTWANDPALRDGVLSLSSTLLGACLGVLMIIVAFAAVWFIGFEASPSRATPGKRALGLQVAAVDGGRAGFGRVLLRFVAGAPSWLLLHLGHAIAGWRRDRRALHDLVAGTRVLLAPGAPSAMPRWAFWWLCMQAAALAAAFFTVLSMYAVMFYEAASGGLA